MDRRSFLKVSTISLLTTSGFSSLLGASRGNRPNVILIMTDQQFADAISCVMGNKYINTPNIDSIAENGMLFERAYCANPLCVPSRSSMFTGRYPHETGKQINATKPQLNPEKFPNAGMLMKKAGYATGYFGKWHLPYPTKGKAEVTGFDEMVIGGNGIDARIAKPSMEFIKKHRSEKFFMVCSFMNPHNICEYGRGQNLPDGDVGKPPSLDDCPPVPYNMEKAKGQSDTLETIWQGRLRAKRSADQRTFAPLEKWKGPDWQKYRWAYYRMVEFVDREVGRILRELRSSGLEENTVIMFTADHGDGIGSHRWAQKNMFYDEVARIPMIISQKGTTKIARSDYLVNNGIDIVPTLCDYAGIKLPEKCSGISLRSVAEGKTARARDYVVCSTHFVQDKDPQGKPIDIQGRMIRTDRYKYYIFDKGRQPEMLIDMQNDPGEMVNLAVNKSYSKILEKHRHLLSKYADSYKDTVAAEILLRLNSIK